MRVSNILELIGKTPHVRIHKLFPAYEVWCKLEYFNPAGSIKDRIALAMVEDAEAKGLLQKDTVIVEPTSGNTGIGLALVAALKGYKIILVMPESMSIERRKLMSAYGADFELTPREKGMKGAIEKAQQLLQELPHAWMPQQFNNAANVSIHMKTTASEIIEDFPEGFDYFFAGVGTGGHLTGVGTVLKQKFPHIKIIAVEPQASAVLSGGTPAPHPIQGIGAGFIPSILNRELIHKVITISKEEAFDFTRKAAREEGICGGISSGAVLAAVQKMLPEIPVHAKILVFNYDFGERYLSVEDLF